ncbi:MAG: bifunctional 2-C-methyl-D-erythritol 4-phosphate cytidylyltransferase/2-C-methyl-D-erythritol 2,4-cyclodiphosphate synthase [Pseudomonadota bacterium]|nr:bifunctional 2-C-methyl-D-erythritol 4-phosphate cytidylyltransferase/2-C-methyl-D-erythritol 2,4-cyclodiphosphate synthase [Pseudomonadota bacterium]
MPSSAETRPSPFHAVIVAAGKGVRAGGGLPKQYRPVGGIPLIRRTLEAFLRHPACGHVVLVIGDGQAEICREALGPAWDRVVTVTGGATRQISVRSGLTALAGMADQEETVLIHDGARPFVSIRLIDAVLDGVRPDGGALPGLPVIDTLKAVPDGDTVTGTVPRDGLYRAQTPQAFPLGAILAAHQSAEFEVTDDAALFEQAGKPVWIVPGDPANVKLTTEEDFSAAEDRLAALMETRTGMGFDVHRFAPGDGVWLCGVFVPHDRRLDGHSDADVGLHAITDALLGAIGDGDIGSHFPPSDPQWRGASSDRFLRHAADLVAAAGGQIRHVDATIICERPKVGPHRDGMRARVAEILAIAPGRVSVKATTTEKLGFTGRGEGIACQAIATVALPAGGDDH